MIEKDITVPLELLDEAIEDDVESKVRRIILSVFANLDSASPLGRPELWASRAPKGYRPGWFKANWRVVFFNTDDGNPVPDNARGVVKPNLAGYKFGRPAAILNNAPYAERLGQGYSAQAPIGWIDGAIKAGIRHVSR